MYAEAGSSPRARPPPDCDSGVSSFIAESAALSVAPLVSYSRVDGIPWVRSGRELRSGSDLDAASASALCEGFAEGVDSDFGVGA